MDAEIDAARLTPEGKILHRHIVSGIVPATGKSAGADIGQRSAGAVGEEQVERRTRHARGRIGDLMDGALGVVVDDVTLP